MDSSYYQLNPNHRSACIYFVLFSFVWQKKTFNSIDGFAGSNQYYASCGFGVGKLNFHNGFNYIGNGCIRRHAAFSCMVLPLRNPSCFGITRPQHNALASTFSVLVSSIFSNFSDAKQLGLSLLRLFCHLLSLWFFVFYQIRCVI
jgi:hypothetical protein